MAAKRILILNNRVPFPLNDGGNIAVNAMIKGYTEAGWQVYLLAMNTSRHHVPQGELNRLYTDIHTFETVYVNNDVKPLQVMMNYLFSKEPNHAVRFKSKEYAAALQKALDKFKPDVVQVESIFLTGYLDVIKQSKALTVLRLHNIEYQVWQRLAAETKGIKGMYLADLAKRIQVYERNAWQQYNLLLPITQADAALVQAEVQPAHMVTVPFGIDTNIPATAGGSLNRGYHIGAMDWLPNQEAINWFLDEIWPEVHEAVPTFKFYFAGRNMGEEYKQKKITGVTCMGEVPDANKFVDDKKILIVPLRSGGGIRVKILEAMAMGKLVISTDVGMQGIDAQPGTHYLPANTPTQFAKAIKWADEYQREAYSIAEAGEIFVHNRYDRRQISNKVIEKVDNMLEER